MPVRSVDANTLKQWLDKGQAVLVDVREPAEYGAESIPGATHIPLARVSKKVLPELAGRKLVIHCRSGKRGGTACDKLFAETPDLEIYNLEGGIVAWTQAGYEVKKSGRFFLPLDRQVQLAIGSSLLLFSFLGYYFDSTFFFWLTGFLGAGLAFAGLSGICGLALLMAKAPWNQRNSPSPNFCAMK
ncbi:MAG: rhodanese-like domain-containing protein [Alphaproteobacteria bacterium]